MRLVALLALALAAPAYAQAPAPAPAAPPQAEGPLVAEARAFMAAYADELRRGDRAAIAARYDRRGAWRLGNGLKAFVTWAEIQAHYAGPDWHPPASFAWHDLSFEPAGAVAVVVAGTFEWTPSDGRAPVTLSYSSFLVRQNGALRIRLEDESAPLPPRAAN